MTRQDTAVLAIRLAALYAWFQAVEYVATGVISLFFAQSKLFGVTSSFTLALAFLPFLALTIAGLFLWIRARALARHFLARESGVVSAPTSSTASPSLAFAVVGLALFVYALPHFVNECIMLLRSEHFTGRDAAQEFLQRLPSLLANAVELVFGFVLFIKSDKIARSWQRKGEADVSV